MKSTRLKSLDELELRPVSTPATTDTSETSQNTSSTVNSVVIPEQETHLRLAYSLHSSLDFQRVIEQFFDEIKTKFSIESAYYTVPGLEQPLLLGEIKKHSCNYQLRIENEYLGEIIFTRQRPLPLAETNKLEELLCILLHPLHNALQYYQAVQSSLRDPLTGIFNRNALYSSLLREIELAKRYSSTLSLLALDLDHFKAINDKFGHGAGDEALKRFTTELSKCIRASDLAFRVGGEEFMVILNSTDTEGAIMLANRICKTIEQMQCKYRKNHIKLTVSIGVSSYVAGDNENTLIEKADKALYLAKRQGRNRIGI